MIVFFQIGATDISAYIDYQNYEMTQEAMYEAWTDANGIEHRNVYRTRNTGEFKAGFKSKADLDTFTALMAANITADGYYPVTAYIVNTGTTEVFNAFIETEAEAKWDFVNSRVWHEVTCKITQR